MRAQPFIEIAPSTEESRGLAYVISSSRLSRWLEGDALRRSALADELRSLARALDIGEWPFSNLPHQSGDAYEHAERVMLAATQEMLRLRPDQEPASGDAIGRLRTAYAEWLRVMERRDPPFTKLDHHEKRDLYAAIDAVLASSR